MNFATLPLHWYNWIALFAVMTYILHMVAQDFKETR